MITDKDIEKLKKVFFTKEDGMQLEARLEAKFDKKFRQLSREIKAIHQDLIHHDQRFETIEAHLGLGGGIVSRGRPNKSHKK